MAEQAPRHDPRKIPELSQEMVRLARFDPGHGMHLRCLDAFAGLLDYGYTLKKMAEKELAAHPPLVTRRAEPKSISVASPKE